MSMSSVNTSSTVKCQFVKFFKLFLAFALILTFVWSILHFKIFNNFKQEQKIKTEAKYLICCSDFSHFTVTSQFFCFQTSLKYWGSEVAKLRKLKTGHCVDSAVIIILCWGSSTSSNHEVACWKLSSIQNQYYCWGSWTNGVRALGRWVQCQRIYSIQRREV